MAAGRQGAGVRPEHRVTKLESGVRVVSEPMPAVRSVALGVWIGTGSAMESSEQAGTSHLLEHMLFRGSARYESREIDEIFDEMGAEINAGTGKETTSLYTRVLDVHLGRAFEVMADMVWRPRMAELEAEREVVLEEIAMYEDDPQDRVFDVLGEALFGSHPLGRAVIGRADVVGRATVETLRAFHAERYVPREIVIAAAGSVDHEELVEMARAAAGPTQVRAGEPPGGSAQGDAGEPPGGSAEDGAGEPPAPWREAAERPPMFERRVLFMAKETEQYHVCLGGPGLDREDERRFALRVLENVIGASSSSRLFQEVRERRGLAYAVFSFSSLYARTGDVGVYIGTRPENLAQALEVVAEELGRLVREPITEQELLRSRENLKGRMVLALESTGSRMNRLGVSVLHGLPIMSVDEVIQRIDAVGIAELSELADELFTLERFSVAAIGPDEEAFRDALAGLPLAGAGGGLVGTGASG
jgi:predicted Zn-dependent peptidase